MEDRNLVSEDWRMRGKAFTMQWAAYALSKAEVSMACFFLAYFCSAVASL